MTLWRNVPLLCYTCMFPPISTLDCIRFPLKCNTGQLCLSSRPVGNRSGHVVLYEKICALSSLCSLTGEKFVLGVNFTANNDCCDTKLCNGVGAEESHGTTAILLLPTFSLLCGN
nr:prostate stem cell antigen-like [Paramormyrops kingsleyae]